MISHDIELNADAVVGIHEVLVDWFAEDEDPIAPPGVRDRGLIESACSRPFQSAGGEPSYTTIYDQAAALFHSLINNHPFYNGNKRVALVSASVFLSQGGLWMERPTDDEVYKFTTDAASHTLTERRETEVPVISGWLEANTRKVVRGEHPLKYGALKEALEKFGFTIDPPDGTLLNIYKDEEVVERVAKQGIQGFRPYHTDFIWNLRKRLNLTPDYGVDSNRFYGTKGVYDLASEFIELRIEVMRRLAKT